MVFFKLFGFLVKPWIRCSLLKVTAVTSQVTREVTVTVRCRMGPASSREDEDDPAATDNGLAIAIPAKTSENQDEQQQQQPPEETVSVLLLSDWCNQVLASWWYSIWHLSVELHPALLQSVCFREIREKKTKLCVNICTVYGTWSDNLTNNCLPKPKLFYVKIGNKNNLVKRFCFSVQYTVYSAQYTLHSIQYTLYSIQYTYFSYNIKPYFSYNLTTKDFPLSNWGQFVDALNADYLPSQ